MAWIYTHRFSVPKAALFFAAYIFAIWLYSHKLKRHPFIGLLLVTVLTLCKTCHRKYDNDNINENSQVIPITQTKERSALKIGKFVKITFNELVAKNLISSNELENLQKLEYSNSTFYIQYPFLSKVRVKDPGGLDRYWKTPVIIHQKEFFICSQWYEVPENNDRPYYKKWLAKINLLAASKNQPNSNINNVENSLVPNDIRSNFKKWLEDNGYKDNTAGSYSGAISRISKHYSEQTNQTIDLYSITDLVLLKSISSKYDQKGNYSEFGDRGRGTNRNALRRFLAYKEEYTIVNTLDSSPGKGL